MYMVHQRTISAVRDGYVDADTDELERQLAAARKTIAWLEGLTVDAGVRASLVEPIAAVQEGLAACARNGQRSGG